MFHSKFNQAASAPIGGPAAARVAAAAARASRSAMKALANAARSSCTWVPGGKLAGSGAPRGGARPCRSAPGAGCSRRRPPPARPRCRPPRAPGQVDLEALADLQEQPRGLAPRGSCSPRRARAGNRTPPRFGRRRRPATGSSWLGHVKLEIQKSKHQHSNCSFNHLRKMKSRNSDPFREVSARCYTY